MDKNSFKNITPKYIRDRDRLSIISLYILLEMIFELFFAKYDVVPSQAKSIQTNT